MNHAQTDCTKELDALIADHRDRPGALVPLLQAVQEVFGYVSEEAVQRIADALDVFPVDIYGILTFYAQFSLQPRGRHIIRICEGTACYIMGGKELLEHLASRLGIDDGETTADGRFTLERVACLGCCGMAPVVSVDGEFHGKCTPRRLDEVLEKYT